MGREIKFRAWDKATKSMGDNTWLLESDYMLYNLTTPYNHCVNMQYIGLQDINGTEIYEGDIVKTSRYDDAPAQHKQIGTVIYAAPSFRINQHFCEEELQMDFNTFNSVEVVGNIYENKES